MQHFFTIFLILIELEKLKLITCIEKNKVVHGRLGGTAMRVMICDDEKGTCAELEQMVNTFALEKCIKLEVDVFFDGDVLIEYLKTEKAPDILFLDIEIPGKNGVKVGKYIREKLKNPDMFLVYISSKKDYALELFQNQPFDFLVKPIKTERLLHIMEKIFNILDRSESNFEYKNQGNSYRIMYKDILYFQSNGRKVNIVQKEGIRDFYGKLSEVQEACPESLFLRIHKSYLVNMHYVKEITYKWIKMTNGDVLDISKSNRVEIRRKVMESMANEIRYDS